MIVEHVHVNYCAQIWPIVEKYIAEALKYGGDDYTLEQVDGTFIGYHEFNTNQEAADLMFTYFRKPVNITYKPIGASRECFGVESHEGDSVANSLLLDILLDNL